MTDTRSRKIEEIRSNPAGEVCFYFPVTREQWRVSGDLTVVASPSSTSTSSSTPNLTRIPSEELQEERKRAWDALSDAARAQFVWPEPRADRVPGAEGDAAFIRALPSGSTAGSGKGKGRGGRETKPEDADGGPSSQGLVDIGNTAASSAAPATDPSSSPSVDPLFGFPSSADLDAAVAGGFDNFALLLLRPDSVDTLCLKFNPTQTRRVYERGDGGWTAREVNP